MALYRRFEGRKAFSSARPTPKFMGGGGGVSLRRMDKFQVVISENKGEGLFTAQCVEIPGAISQGRTIEEAKENVADAIQMVLAHRRRAAEKSARQPLHFIDVVAVESDA